MARERAAMMESNDLFRPRLGLFKPTPGPRSGKRQSLQLACAAGLACALAAPPSSALQPLEVFVAAAAQHNPDALETQANLELQRAQADLALGRVLPGLVARGSLTRNQFDSVISLGPGQGSVTIVPLNQQDFLATLTVPLIDLAGFERVAAAKSSARAFDQQLAATQLQVQAVVAQDYYQLVANLSLLTAAQKALEVSKENLRLAQNRVGAGVAPQLDVDRARADLEQQNQQVSSAALQIALASRALESAAGMVPDSAAALPLSDDLHAELALADSEANLEHLPSVAAAAGNTHAAEQLATAQRLAFVPTLAGAISERGTSTPGFTGHNWSWQAVLGLNWALDFTTFATLKIQDAAASGARARELRARLGARDAIHRQWQTVTASISRSRSARAGFDAATAAAQSASNRYQAGSTTQLELLQAQRDAFAANVSRIQADADLVNARAQLRLATGMSLLEKKEP